MNLHRNGKRRCSLYVLEALAKQRFLRGPNNQAASIAIGLLGMRTPASLRKIPPALWATGGLEASSFQESFFPKSLFPLGGVLTSPLPLPGGPAGPFGDLLERGKLQTRAFLTSMGPAWALHGPCMGPAWDLMGPAWGLHGISWGLHEVSMGPHGASMGHPWGLHGACMRRPWDLMGPA